jgi:hypothetical protein
MAIKNDSKVGKTASAKDLLAGLGGKKVAKKTEVTERAEIELTPEEAATLDRLGGAHDIHELAKKREEQEKKNLNPSILVKWIERLWKNKSKPSNPLLKTAKTSCIFQVKETMKVQCPKPKEGESLEETLIAKLTEEYVSVGIPEPAAEADAQRVVNEELDFTPKKSIDLNRLVYGEWKGTGDNRTWVEASEAQQALALKVIGILNDNLTDEERDEVIESRDATTVRKGFLGRAHTYVHTQAQLEVLLGMVKPEVAISGVKYVDGVSTVEKKNQQLDVASDLIGCKVKEVAK